MKVLITGGGGQLARELCGRAPVDVEALAPPRSELDITDHDAVERLLDDDAPELVINTAAHTAVDRAESEPDVARAVNAVAAGALAAAATSRGCRVVHLSTDFVFGGATGRPHRIDDPTHPLGVYGRTKLEGERAVLDATNGDALVLRSAWIYSRYGHNFVRTMLRLMADRDRLTVVDDQIGTPTWAGDLARAIWQLAANPRARGILHWTDAGVASWFDFAVAIYEEGRRLGLVDSSVSLEPVPSTAYPTPAERPAFSVLDKTATFEFLDLRPRHWRVALRRMLEGVRGDRP